MKTLTAAVVCLAFGASTAMACPGMKSASTPVDKLAQTLTPKPLISTPKTGS